MSWRERTSFKLLTFRNNRKSCQVMEAFQSRSYVAALHCSICLHMRWQWEREGYYKLFVMIYTFCFYALYDDDDDDDDKLNMNFALKRLENMILWFFSPPKLWFYCLNHILSTFVISSTSFTWYCVRGGWKWWIRDAHYYLL